MQDRELDWRAGKTLEGGWGGGEGEREGGSEGGEGGEGGVGLLNQTFVSFGLQEILCPYRRCPIAFVKDIDMLPTHKEGSLPIKDIFGE